MKSWKGRNHGNPESKAVKAKRAKRRARTQPRAKTIPAAPRSTSKVPRSPKSR